MPRKIVSQLLNSDSTYVMVGGLGGIGKALAEYFVTQGARHLAFLSRSGANSDESKDFLSSFAVHNVQAIAIACDISNKKALAAALQDISEMMPKIKGVVQAAMVLRDRIFDKMTYEEWNITTSAKIQGSWNLHEQMPTDMDFFVLLASASGVIGNPGQANYAAGCASQDQLTHFRRQQGLTATSLDLGAVTGVDYLAEHNEQYQGQEHLEAMKLKEEEMYTLLACAVRGHSRGHRMTAPQISTGIPSGDLLRNIMAKVEWGNDPKLSILCRMDGSKVRDNEDDGTRAALMGTTSILVAAGVVEDALCSRLAKALSISKEDINVNQPMHSYGVDSLVAVEVRNWLIRELQTDISVFDILGTMPISELSVRICKNSKLLQTMKYDANEVGAVTVNLNVATEEPKVDVGRIEETSLERDLTMEHKYLEGTSVRELPNLSIEDSKHEEPLIQQLA